MRGKNMWVNMLHAVLLVMSMWFIMLRLWWTAVKYHKYVDSSKSGWGWFQMGKCSKNIKKKWNLFLWAIFQLVLHILIRSVSQAMGLFKLGNISSGETCIKVIYHDICFVSSYYKIKSKPKPIGYPIHSNQFNQYLVLQSARTPALAIPI